LKIDGEFFSAFLDDKGNIQRITFRDKIFEPPITYTLFEMNGETAQVKKIPSQEGLTLGLTAKGASGKLSVSSGKEIKLHLDPDRRESSKDIGIVMIFPLEAEFHLPEVYNLGRKIDQDMPIRKWHSVRLSYNFFLVDLKDFWLRFMVKQTGKRNPSVYISRHPKMFVVTFTWNVADDGLIAAFASMDEALKDYEDWLEKGLGFKKLRDDPQVPEWVHNVKLFLFIDMMRSYGEIAHDYNDIINLAKDLKKIGCPKDTLLYIPGHNGAYDSAYPSYEPDSELGGAEKFKEMMETLHKNGYRVMMHTNGWGLDPCHPKIDEYLKYVLKDEEGNYEGWQTGGKIWGGTYPASRSLKFQTDKIPLNGPHKAKAFSFETVYVPDTCEALVTVGNLEFQDARVRLTMNRRSMLTPPRWFRDHDEYAFLFPFQLNEGLNKARIEVVGEAEPDWNKAWYQIRYSFIPISGNTYPILRADTHNPEWIKIFVDEVASVVRKYDIDSLHIDATHYERDKDVLDKLKAELPSIPIGGEEIGIMADLGYLTFCQNARQSVLTYADITQTLGTTRRRYIPDRSEIEEEYKWLGKQSLVSSFVKDYLYLYPHLGVPTAFVRYYTIGTWVPPPPTPRRREEQWKALRNSRTLGYIPGLRLNYREYGLDQETVKAIREVATY